MRRAVRIGAVDYLNVRPLVSGLDTRNDIALRFDVPSVCARLLAAGEIDLGMVPSITYLDRPGDQIVPGICIGSDGPVGSVALFTRVPMRQVRTIALDTSSRTSAALVRILCRRVFDIAPVFEPHRPDLAAMLASADAALLIGDPALFVDPTSVGAEKVDLGQVWSEMTGLPFVWAFWSGNPASLVDTGIVGSLAAAAADGRTRLGEIAASYCAATPDHIPVAEAYLRDQLMFDLSGQALKGLEVYYREAVDAGVVDSFRRPAFLSAAQGPDPA